MDDGARGWLAKTARKNYWRVSNFYDIDDLIQEGYLAYYKVLKKYPHATDAPHRMALFQRAFTNRLHDMANERTRGVDEVYAESLRPSALDATEQSGSVLESIAADKDPSSAFVNLVGAPKYVIDALALFTTESGRSRFRSAQRRQPQRGQRAVRRETMNERLCRLTGYDASRTDVVGEIRRLLGFEFMRAPALVYHPVQTEVVVERVCHGERFIRVVRTGRRMVVCAGAGDGLQIDEDLWSRARAVRRVPSVAR